MVTEYAAPLAVSFRQMAAVIGYSVTLAAGFLLSDMVFPFVVDRLQDRSRCNPSSASSKAGMSKARSGIAGSLLREERSEHATSFRETTFRQARRTRYGLHRPRQRLCSFE